jgi:hypothetical protein
VFGDDETSMDALEMSCYENETINTKLAKLDIDKMFCQLEEDDEEERKLARSPPLKKKVLEGGMATALAGDSGGFLSPLAVRRGEGQSADYSFNIMMDDSCLHFEPTREITLGTHSLLQQQPQPMPSKQHTTVRPAFSRENDLSDDSSSSTSQQYFRYSTESASAARRSGSGSGGTGSQRTGGSSTGSRDSLRVSLSPSSSTSSSSLENSKSYLFGCGVHTSSATPSSHPALNKKHQHHQQSALQAIAEHHTGLSAGKAVDSSSQHGERCGVVGHDDSAEDGLGLESLLQSQSVDYSRRKPNRKVRYSGIGCGVEIWMLFVCLSFSSLLLS